MTKTTLDAGALQHLVGFLLALATAETRRVFQANVGDPYELRTVEFTLLLLLLANSGAAPKQLARAMRMTAPNVTVLLDRLVARHLVERRRSSTDGRGLEVVLTVEGDALARKVEAVSRTMEDGLLAALSPGERMLLRELLLKLARTGSAAGPRETASDAGAA